MLLMMIDDILEEIALDATRVTNTDSTSSTIFENMRQVQRLKSRLKNNDSNSLD